VGNVIYFKVLLLNPDKELTAKQIAQLVGVSPDRVYWHMLDFQIGGLVAKIDDRPAKYRLSEEVLNSLVCFAELSKKNK